MALATLLWGGRQGFLCAQTRRASRAEEVAAYFKRPVSEVNDLRTQGFGYGEIVKILVIAQMSKRPLAELLARNQKGYGWGTISVEKGLDPIAVKRRVDLTRQKLHIRVRTLQP